MNIKTLSATARRFISVAVETLDDANRAQAWQNWDAISSADAPPPYIAQIAIHALSNHAIQLEDRLADTQDAAQGAQIENDLGFIADVEGFLAQCLQTAEPLVA